MRGTRGCAGRTVSTAVGRRGVPLVKDAVASRRSGSFVRMMFSRFPFLPSFFVRLLIALGSGLLIAALL